MVPVPPTQGDVGGQSEGLGHSRARRAGTWGHTHISSALVCSQPPHKMGAEALWGSPLLSQSPVGTLGARPVPSTLCRAPEPPPETAMLGSGAGAMPQALSGTRWLSTTLPIPPHQLLAFPNQGARHMDDSADIPRSRQPGGSFSSPWPSPQQKPSLDSPATPPPQPNHPGISSDVFRAPRRPPSSPKSAKPAPRRAAPRCERARERSTTALPAPSRDTGTPGPLDPSVDKSGCFLFCSRLTKIMGQQPSGRWFIFRFLMRCLSRGGGGGRKPHSNPACLWDQQQPGVRSVPGRSRERGWPGTWRGLAAHETPVRVLCGR